MPTLSNHTHCQVAQKANRTSQNLSKSMVAPTHGRKESTSTQHCIRAIAGKVVKSSSVHLINFCGGGQVITLKSATALILDRYRAFKKTTQQTLKQLKIISTIIILTGLFACEPPVTFTEPQPVDTDNLSKFPKRLQGHYLSLSDSSTLTINDNLIQRTYDFDYKIHPNQLDSTARISGDTLINIQTNERELIKRDGDSLMIHIHNVDTLFQMDYDNVVRKFKGYYFLNTRYDKTSWAVEKMQLSKGQLVISGISTKQDIENLKEITETTQDTVGTYNFTTTKRQFKKFVKSDGFSDSETFVRLKK